MICGSCGKEARRIKTVFEKEGKPLPVPKDECEFCDEGGRHEDPAWLRHRPTPRWESHPNEYKKSYGPDGETIYNPTDESLSDLEALVLKPSEDDEQAKRRALQAKQEKAKNLNSSDVNAMIARAHQMVAPAVEEWNRLASVNEEEWQQLAEQFKVQ